MHDVIEVFVLLGANFLLAIKISGFISNWEHKYRHWGEASGGGTERVLE